MKTRSIKSVVMLMIAVAAMGIGCAEKGNKRERITGGRDTRNTGGVTPNSGEQNNPSAWPGVVFVSSAYASLFQQAAEDFVSSFMDPRNLGTVDPTPNGTTGVRFQARAGSTVTGNQISVPAVGSGSLSILIWDSAVGTNGNLPIVVSDLQLVRRSTVSGTRMVLEYENGEYGYVGLDGVITGSGTGRLYQGEIYFENAKDYVNPNAQPAKWTKWADFAIACNAIFTCP